VNVLVTGANGFLGHWLVQALCREGHTVKAMLSTSNKQSSLQELPCKIVHGDITQIESISSFFPGVDAVFHLAAAISFKKADNNKLYAVNVDGTRNIVTLCLSNKIAKLIHLSSVVAIGASSNSQTLLNEQSINHLATLNVASIQSKILGEKIVLSACQEKGLNATILNPSLIYGAGDAKKAMRHSSVQAARGKLPFYTDGGVSIVAVEDVVAAILSAWQKGKSGQRYILSGDNITNQELFFSISKQANAKPPKTKLPNALLLSLAHLADFFRIDGMLSIENVKIATMYHWYDNSKAKRELDFHPRPALEAIKNSVSWMRENGYF